MPSAGIVLWAGYSKIPTRLRTHKMDSPSNGFVIQGFRKETIDGSRLFLAQRGAILAV